jgi:acyl-CoA thioesterase FadM
MRDSTCLAKGQVTLALVSSEHGRPRRIPTSMRQKITDLQG